MFTSKLPARTSFTALALLLATTATACGSRASSADDTGASVPGDDPGQQPAGSPDAGDAGGPKAPPVQDTPTPDTITETQGIFVSPKGSDMNDGTRAAPLATLQAAIASAAKVGKIVFACTGTYNEALVVADSISIIGGMNCSDPTAWRTGATPSKIQSPTSPAATATSLSTLTRLEALDIVAPDATDAGASSIGLLADHSPNLTIVNSKITAGNGAKGTDGANGVQLALGPNAPGAATVGSYECHGPDGTGKFPTLGNCGYVVLIGGASFRTPSSGPSGGVGQCVGAAGHDGGPSAAGGAGGIGGLFQLDAYPPKLGGPSGFHWAFYQENSANNSTAGAAAGSGAAGAAGENGAPATDIGSLTINGYQPASGNAGKDGTSGAGGSGGHGGGAADAPDPNSVGEAGQVYTGASGPGGGAGGCPGLAGSGGTGGGASLGLALVESPIVLDGTTVISAAGGAAGLGSVGSDPTDGGAPGANGGTATPAMPGGRGGAPGVSTNGGNGPSVAILHTGTSPTLKGSSKAIPGSAAPAIDAVPSPDGTRSVPATPAGIVTDIKAL